MINWLVLPAFSLAFFTAFGIFSFGHLFGFVFRLFRHVVYPPDDFD